jgi:levanbiose-producing levanase
VSTPLDALDAVTGPPVPLGGMPSDPSAVPVPFSGLHRFTRPTPSDSLRLDLDIESDAPYRLRLLDGDAASATVTVEPAHLRVAVDRASASPARGVLGPTWTARHVGELAPQARERLRTRMSLLVDRGTLECFVDDGAVCLSAASGLGEVVAIELEADGSVLVHAATAAPIRTVQLA